MTVGKISPLSPRQASFPYKESKISRLFAATRMKATDFSRETFSKEAFLQQALNSGVCSEELIDEILGTDECEFKLAPPANSEEPGNLLSNKFEECIKPYKSSFDNFENDASGIFFCRERIDMMKEADDRLEEFSKTLRLSSKWTQVTVRGLIIEFSADRCGRDWRACSDTISFLQQFFRNELFRRPDERASDGIFIERGQAEEQMEYLRRLAIYAVDAYEKSVGDRAGSELPEVLRQEASVMKRHISRSNHLDEKTRGLLLEKVEQIEQLCLKGWDQDLYCIAISEMHQLLSGKVQEMRAVRRNTYIDSKPLGHFG